jgi:hypothetical protein
MTKKELNDFITKTLFNAGYGKGYMFEVNIFDDVKHYNEANSGRVVRAGDQDVSLSEARKRVAPGNVFDVRAYYCRNDDTVDGWELDGHVTIELPGGDVMQGQQLWEWCYYDSVRDDWDFFPTLESLIEHLKTEENSTLFERLTLNKETDSEIVLKLRGVNDLLDEFELTVDGLPQQSEHAQYKIPNILVDQVRRALILGSE